MQRDVAAIMGKLGGIHADLQLSGLHWEVEIQVSPSVGVEGGGLHALQHDRGVGCR